nr:DEAD/DEAH box helicase [Rathayibacter festucae]
MADSPKLPRPQIPTRRRPQAVSDSPETLFGELPRRRDGVGALWSHQVDQLREYKNLHVDRADVALELPTGSGKTLVGLLIGEWRRRQYNQRVVYACPTRQLALQVVEAGAREGIHTHALIDKSRDWNMSAVSAYTRAEAIAVTTYAHIFNSNPRLGDAGTVIFDDAHAAEGYVADSWSLEIKTGSAAYAALFEAFGETIDAQLATRMVSSSADTFTDQEVRLLPLVAVSQRLQEIDGVLSTHLVDRSPEWYGFRRLRARLASCLFYVSRSGWYIRPMIPPTFDHDAFTDPIQRLYLSATLGEAGELERAFGRSPISRIASPPAWEKTGSGRRFIVFPDLAQYSPEDDREYVKVLTPDADNANGGEPATLKDLGALPLLTRLAGKKLLLTQKSTSAAAIADALGVPQGERFIASDRSVEQFKEAAVGTLIAPNRYDGMDLADEACRFMVMSEVPTASHLQDKFLSSKLRAGDLLDERIRSRVVQGLGRCTRGPRDWAVVAIVGDELVRYLSDQDHTRSMPLELQAEIEFGLSLTGTSYANMVALAQSALDQDAFWRESGEAAIADDRATLARSAPPLAAELEGSAPREVLAWRHAWSGSWEEAARSAVLVLEGLTEPRSQPYRALWAYFASAWFALAHSAGVPGMHTRSAELLRTAHRASSGMVWMREIQPLPLEAAMPNPCDESAANGAIEIARGSLRSSSVFGTRAQEMLRNLSQTAAVPYEAGLVELGLMLGSRSFKPAGSGRTDAAWIWNELWMTVEAKSEQTAEVLSLEYTRKTNSQLDLLEADEGTSAPIASVSVIVANSKLIHPDAVTAARPHLHIVDRNAVLALARDAHRAMIAIRTLVGRGDDPELPSSVARVMWDHRVQPTQVRERLTVEPIRGSRVQDDNTGGSA